jgi:cytochrome bd-type quinol oxidase subunit 2
MLASIAWVLPQHPDRDERSGNSLNVINATAGAYGMQAGLWWLLIGFLLLLAYQYYAHRLFWGKVEHE